MDYKELTDILTKAGFCILLQYGRSSGGIMCDTEIETPLILKRLFEKDEKKLQELHDLISTGKLSETA